MDWYDRQAYAITRRAYTTHDPQKPRLIWCQMKAYILYVVIKKRDYWNYLTNLA